MGTMIVMKPGDDRAPRLKLEGQPTLEQVQALVGGYVEMVTQWTEDDGRPAQMLANEEGLLKNLPPNSVATQMLTKIMGGPPPQLADGFLRGAVVVLIGEDVVWD